MELIKWCYKLKTKKQFTNFDKWLIEVVLYSLKNALFFVIIDDNFDYNLFNKINKKINQIKIDNFNGQIDMKTLKSLLKDILKTIKLLKTSITKLKSEYDKEHYILNSNEIMLHTNEIRFKLAKNNLDVEKDLLKLSQFAFQEKNIIMEIINDLANINIKNKIYALLDDITKKLGFTHTMINKLTSDQ